MKLGDRVRLLAPNTTGVQCHPTLMPVGAIGTISETDDGDGWHWVEFDDCWGEWVEPKLLRALRTLELLADCAE